MVNGWDIWTRFQPRLYPFVPFGLIPRQAAEASIVVVKSLHALGLQNKSWHTRRQLLGWTGRSTSCPKLVHRNLDLPARRRLRRRNGAGAVHLPSIPMPAHRMSSSTHLVLRPLPHRPLGSGMASGPTRPSIPCPPRLAGTRGRPFSQRTWTAICILSRKDSTQGKGKEDGRKRCIIYPTLDRCLGSTQKTRIIMPWQIVYGVRGSGGCIC